MYTQGQFVIYEKKMPYVAGLIFISICSLALIFFDDFRESYQATRFARLPDVLVKVFLYVGIIFFSSALIYKYKIFFAKNLEILAIVNAQGIWINEFGSIPWANVANVVQCYYPAGSKFEYVGIQFKDITTIRDQASWAGKCRLFCAKTFGYYHAMLTNATVSNNEIMSAIKHYRDVYAKSK